MREATRQIVEAVISVLEQTPPELSADILDRGIVLTGGGAMLRGLEELIEEKTGINTMTAEDPMKVVAIGTGPVVEFMSGSKDFCTRKTERNSGHGRGNRNLRHRSRDGKVEGVIERAGGNVAEGESATLC